MLERQQFSRPSCFPFPQQPSNNRFTVEQILKTPTLGNAARKEFTLSNKKSMSPTRQIHMIKSIKTKKKAGNAFDNSTIKKPTPYFPMIGDGYKSRKRQSLLEELKNKQSHLAPKDYIFKRIATHEDNSLNSYLKKIREKKRSQNRDRSSRKKNSFDSKIKSQKKNKDTYSHKSLQRSAFSSPVEKRKEIVYSKLTFTSLKTQFQNNRVSFFIIYNQNKKMNKLLGKSETRIPRIPHKEDLASFLLSYKTCNEEINMKELLKKNFCAIEYSEEELFIGEMIGKHKNGVGVLITEKSCFEGEWKNNQKTKGIEITQEGVYKGYYENNLKNGSGQYHRHSGDIYVGEWKAGKQHGIGLWINEQGQSYNGSWIVGRAEGMGTLTLKKRTYKGWFMNFRQQGFGKETFSNGDTFEGIYKNDLPDGKGIYRWKSGSVFQGNFFQGLREGWGQLKLNSQLLYCGQFNNDKPEGQCQIYANNLPVWSGIARNGQTEKLKCQISRARGALSMLNMREGRYA